MILDFFLEKLAVDNYPEVQSNKCLFTMYDSQDCHSCEVVCPEEAVSLKDTRVFFDVKKCIGCGICKSICPTQAIMLRGLGEENILRTIKDKKNIVFSCSKVGGIGTLKLSCLNAFHPELLATLFISNPDKTFYFNLSKCSNCKLGNSNHLLFESINKAISLVKILRIEPTYKIVEEEKELINLPEDVLSRRDLLLLFKKKSTNLATKAAETIVNDKDQISIRKVLLKSIDKRQFNDTELFNIPFFESWDVNNSCNGCGICQKSCPGEAWKIDIGEEKIKLYHNSVKCYKCGICKDKCPQNAISEGIFSTDMLMKYNIKKEIDLVICKTCNNKFVPQDEGIEICPICAKKLALRKKIASF